MHYLKCLLLVLGLCPGILSTLHAQDFHVPVFPSLKGQELLDSLLQTYKSFSLLPYSTCRDTLFAKIDAQNDSLECIYTGMKRYIPPGQDPTDAVLLNGQPNGINTEHAYPQSKGASGYGRSDMHILYPSRVKTNTTRSNNPFKEIPDSETTIWFYKTQELGSPPFNNRDAYSESTSLHFEPRESKKGDIARSMFYFFSMYYLDAQQADPDFFPLQKEDLCTWHFADPVDSLEWVRNSNISQYQGNLNPFVLDCSLASRTYCDKISDVCLSLSNVQVPSLDIHAPILFPNPGFGTFSIKHFFGPGAVQIVVRSLSGQIIHKIEVYAETDTLNLSMLNLAGGLYFINFIHEKRPITQTFKYLVFPD